MSGGSAGSGEVKYPEYLSKIPTMAEDWRGYHVQYLNHMTDEIDAYLGVVETGGLADDLSPYEGENAYDPTVTELPAIDASVATFKALAAAYSGSTLWSAAVTAADAAGGNLDALPSVDTRLATLVAAMRNVISAQMTSAEAGAATVTSSAIQAALSIQSGSTVEALILAAQDDYERGLMPAFYRSVNRFTSGMADINAVMSSSFVMGLAHMESQLQHDIAKFSTDIKMQLLTTLSGQYLQVYASLIGVEVDALMKGIASYTAADVEYSRNKSYFLNQAIAEIMKSHDVGYDLRKASTSLEIDAAKTAMIAKKEQIDKDLEIDVLDAKWPMDVLLMGGNLIASITGAAHTIDKPISTAQSAISGAMSGAAIGNTIGGPRGAGIGAVLGAATAFLK